MIKNIITQFKNHHKEPINLLLHVISMTIGFTCFFSLIGMYSAIFTFLLICIVTNFLYIKNNLLLNTFSKITTPLFMLFLVFSSQILFKHIENYLLIIGVVSSYFLQSISHIICNENTSESEYKGKGLKFYFNNMVLHTCLLAYMLFESIYEKRKELFNLIKSKSWVISSSVNPNIQSKNIEIITNWIKLQRVNNISKSTQHWWFTDLNDNKEMSKALNEIIYDKNILNEFQKLFPEKHFIVKPAIKMNEIYVSSLEKTNKNSDFVFYSEHIDGPLGWFYGFYLYRVMLGLNENYELETKFPMQPFFKTISKYEFVGFDFNREIHFISKTDKKNLNDRMNLKLHYYAIPKYAKFFENIFLNLMYYYDRTARNLFLFTLNCTSLKQKISFYYIMFCTKFLAYYERYIGFNSTLYLLIVAGLSIFLKSKILWFILTSFIHYIIYIATWNNLNNISFYRFIRNSILFKTISMLNIAYMMYINYSSYTNLLFILPLAFGCILSALASIKLGLEGTYFGVEAGICKKNLIKVFPYSYFSNPMMIGQIISFISLYFFKIPIWLIVIHVTFLSLHTYQERNFEYS